jgi:hypothetical protein
VGRTLTLGLPALPDLVSAMTTVEAGVVTGRPAFPTATTSPFSTAIVAGAAVTALLARLSTAILGRRRALLLLLLLLASEPLLLSEEQLAGDVDGVGRRRFLTVIDRLEPPYHLLNGQGREVQESLH